MGSAFNELEAAAAIWLSIELIIGSLLFLVVGLILSENSQKLI
jgi:DMSO reductase anchor subunit